MVVAIMIIVPTVISASDSAFKKPRSGSGSEASVSNETTTPRMPSAISATINVLRKPFDGMAAFSPFGIRQSPFGISPYAFL